MLSAARSARSVLACTPGKAAAAAAEGAAATIVSRIHVTQKYKGGGGRERGAQEAHLKAGREGEQGVKQTSPPQKKEQTLV